MKKFNFKKIASALTSTALIGSTVALAAAASYPSPFVNNGMADVAIVWGGSGAASADQVSALTIGQSLQEAIAEQGGSNVVVDEESAFPLFTSSTEIYLNDSLNVAKSSLTEDDLPDMLADGQFSGNVDSDYTQIITLLPNSRVLFGQEPTNDDDPQVFVNIGTSQSSPVYNASITFDQVVNFTLSDSQGESFDLFGKEWTVGADTTNTDLVLYESSERIALSLGGDNPNPSATITVEGVQYTIELVAASDTSATIRVTDASGETQTKEIDEDDSKQVNGVEVSVAYSDESDATGIVSAEVTVGSEKITLQNGQNVKVGSDETSLDGTVVSFNGAGPYGLTKLTFTVFSDDTDADAITTGSAFPDPIFGNFDLFFKGLNIALDDDERDMISIENSGDDTAVVSFTDHAGNTKTVKWALNNSEGGADLLHLAYGSQGNELLRVVEGAQLNKSMYVMVGNQDEGYLLRLKTVSNSSSDTNDEVEFENVFDTSKTYATSVTAEGVGTVTIGGRTYSVTYNGVSTDSSNIDVRLNYPDSSAAATVIVYPTIETDKGAKVGFYEPVTIDLNNYDGAGTDVTGIMIPDGDDYGTTVTVALSGIQGGFTVGGTLLNSTLTTSVVQSIGNLSYNFTYNSVNTTKIFLISPVDRSNIRLPAMVTWEEEEDRTNAFNAIVTTLTPQAGSDDLEIADVQSTSAVASTASGNNDGNDYVSLETDDDMSQLMTMYGSVVTLNNPTSGSKTAEISYPDDQAQAMMYLALTDMSGDGGSSLGSVTVTDDEVSTVSSKNLIVVGGSAVNSVAADLLGGAFGGAAFEEASGAGAGQFVIETFSRAGGKVATLVAGYNAADTTNAAKYLTTSSVDTTVGKKYLGTSSTSASLVTESA